MSRLAVVLILFLLQAGASRGEVLLPTQVVHRASVLPKVDGVLFGGRVARCGHSGRLSARHKCFRGVIGGEKDAGTPIVVAGVSVCRL